MNREVIICNEMKRVIAFHNSTTSCCSFNRDQLNHEHQLNIILLPNFKNVCALMIQVTYLQSAARDLVIAKKEKEKEKGKEKEKEIDDDSDNNKDEDEVDMEKEVEKDLEVEEEAVFENGVEGVQCNMCI